MLPAEYGGVAYMCCHVTVHDKGDSCMWPQNPNLFKRAWMVAVQQGNAAPVLGTMEMPRTVTMS